MPRRLWSCYQYRHPSCTKIYFDAGDELIRSIEVYDINGTAISVELDILATNGSMDMLNLVKGVYIFTCRTKDNVHTAKFLVI